MEALLMTVEHSDIFHCLKCGRLAFEPHGTSPPPACCGQPMVRAVADVVKEGPRTVRADAERAADVEEYALLAEAMELSHWSRSFPDTDVSRYEDLAQRVEALARAVADQFQSEERAADLAKAIGGIATHRAAVERLRDEERALFSAFDRFVADLRRGPTSFRGWAEVCDRLDLLTSAFREHEETESELVRRAIQEDSRPRI
jgi:hypothetical protein